MKIEYRRTPGRNPVVHIHFDGADLGNKKASLRTLRELFHLVTPSCTYSFVLTDVHHLVQNGVNVITHCAEKIRAAGGVIEPVDIDPAGKPTDCCGFEWHGLWNSFGRRDHPDTLSAERAVDERRTSRRERMEDSKNVA